MSELRLLQVDHAYHYGNFGHLPQGLKWLSLKGLSSKCVLTIAHLEKLAVLDLSRSMITEDWNGWQQIQLIRTLKVLVLSSCNFLKRTPHFSCHTSLQRLILDQCISLVAFHESIGHLKKLVFLSLKCCENLTELPDGICKLSSIRSLILSRCLKLEKLPKELGNIKTLTELIIDETTIEELPDSIGLLEKLERLSARQCLRLQSLPELPCSLIKLDTRECCSIQRLPNLSNLKNLQSLHLCGRNLSKIQDISRLSLLQELDLEDCKMLQSLPGLPPSLIRLQIKGCISMERLPNLSRLKILKVLRLDNCTTLTSIQSINDLSLLQELDLCFCSKLQSLSELPSGLSRLNVYWCENLFKIQGISGLSLLQTLHLEFCPMLQSLPKLPSNLITLDVACCFSMKNLPDLSNLKILENLRLECCYNLAEIQGFESLESLIDLRVCRCHTYVKTLPKSVAQGRLPTAFIEGRIWKNYLIPDDDNIKGTIFYFVYELLQDPASSRSIDRVDFSIAVEIQRNDNKTIQCFHDLRIEGMIANTNKDQFYSCYFQGLTWFDFPLKKRDIIHVTNVSFQSKYGLECYNASPPRSQHEVKLKMLDFVMEYKAKKDGQQLKKQVVNLITSTCVEREGGDRARERDDAGPSIWRYIMPCVGQSSSCPVGS